MYYKINEKTMYIKGFYNKNGYLCSEIGEPNGVIIIDQSPLKIIEHSIRSIGYELHGAMAAARSILGIEKMPPIMVDPINGIVLFAIKSHFHGDNIWFNPKHIKRTTSCQGATLIHFYNGTTYLVPLRLISFNNKLILADQYINLTIGPHHFINPASTTSCKKPEIKFIVFLNNREKHKTDQK